MSDINSFLEWLVTSSGAVAAASWIVEQIEWFQKISSKTRQYIFIAISIVIALGAYSILTYVPEEVIEQLAPWFRIVAGVIVVYFSGQIAHALNPNRRY